MNGWVWMCVVFVLVFCFCSCVCVSNITLVWTDVQIKHWLIDSHTRTHTYYSQMSSRIVAERQDKSDEREVYVLLLKEVGFECWLERADGGVMPDTRRKIVPDSGTLTCKSTLTKRLGIWQMGCERSDCQRKNEAVGKVYRFIGCHRRYSGPGGHCKCNSQFLTRWKNRPSFLFLRVAQLRHSCGP